VKLATHMALNADWSRRSSKNQVKQYGPKGGDTGKGVDLPKRLVQGCRVGGEERKNTADTDPYRPPIRTAPSDDIDLIAKGCEELPTESGGGCR
jgi:hypothetical protein